jgi:hypothetical protein
MWVTDSSDILKLSTGTTISLLDDCNVGIGINMLLADGKYIWAAGGGLQGGVARINRDDLTHDYVPLGGGEDNCHLAFDGRYIWISSHIGIEGGGSFVYVVDPDTLRTITSFAYEQPPEFENPDISKPSAMIFDGKDMWILNEYDGEGYITKIDTTTYKVVSNDFPASSSIIQLIFDGCNVWGVDPEANGGGLWKF